MTSGQRQYQFWRKAEALRADLVRLQQLLELDGSFKDVEADLRWAGIMVDNACKGLAAGFDFKVTGPKPKDHIV